MSGQPSRLSQMGERIKKTSACTWVWLNLIMVQCNLLIALGLHMHFGGSLAFWASCTSVVFFFTHVALSWLTLSSKFLDEDTKNIVMLISFYPFGTSLLCFATTLLLPWCQLLVQML